MCLVCKVLAMHWWRRQQCFCPLGIYSPGCSLEGLMAKAETRILWPPHVLTHWKRLWCWEGLGAGGEGDDRGWDGWMASLTRWMWVWVNPGSWWWTGRPGVLWFMGSQKVGHDWVTELNWTELKVNKKLISATHKEKQNNSENGMCCLQR